MEAVGEEMLVNRLGVDTANDAMGCFIEQSQPFGGITIECCLVE